ncbi:MAG: TolC family protein [Bacteroidota bacterium]
MRYTTLLLAGIICSLNLCAQETLSLSQAIEAGLANNFDIRIERGNVDVARVNNTWGEAGVFPSLTFTAIGSYDNRDTREVINPFAFLARTETYQMQPAVNLNWNLLSLKNIQISKRRLEQLQAESQGNASIVIANSLQSIILGYYVAVLEKERLRQFEEQMKLSRDKYEKLKIKKEIGGAVTSDLLLEEGNYLTDSTNFLNQQLQYENAITNLNFLIGIPEPATRYILSDSLDTETMEVDLIDLIDLMEQENVDVKTQYITQSVLGLDVQQSRWNRFPTLSIGGNYTFTRNTQDVSDWPEQFRQNPDGSTFSTGNNENTNWGLNFTISFNLFDGGRINRAIQRALIQENIGETRVDRLKTSLRRDLKQAIDQYNTRKQLYLINQRRSAAANQMNR